MCYLVNAIRFLEIYANSEFDNMTPQNKQVGTGATKERLSCAMLQITDWNIVQVNRFDGNR